MCTNIQSKLILNVLLYTGLLAVAIPEWHITMLTLLMRICITHTEPIPEHVYRKLNSRRGHVNKYDLIFFGSKTRSIKNSFPIDYSVAYV